MKELVLNVKPTDVSIEPSESDDKMIQYLTLIDSSLNRPTTFKFMTTRSKDDIINLNDSLKLKITEEDSEDSHLCQRMFIDKFGKVLIQFYSSCLDIDTYNQDIINFIRLNHKYKITIIGDN